MTSKMHAAIVVVLALAALGTVRSQDIKEVRKSGPLSPDGRVVIDTYKGSITITTWDRPEFDVYAKVEPDGWDRYAEERVQDTEIRIDAYPSTVRIRSDYGRVRRRSGGFWGIFDGNSVTYPFVHYTIKMPATARLSVKDYKSRSEISDLRGDLEIETYKGRAEITNLEGSLTLDTYKGDVRVEFAQLGGRSRCETYRGSVEISIPGNRGFDLDAYIGKRGIFRIDFDLKKSYRSSRKRDYEYYGAVNGGGPLLRIKTTRGNIRLAAR